MSKLRALASDILAENTANIWGVFSLFNTLVVDLYPRITVLKMRISNSISTRQASRVAGVGYILLFALAIFANFFVREGLVVPGNAVQTATNIAESGMLFRFGMVSFLIVFLLDVFVAWALHVIFRDVSHDYSLLAAWFRLVYTVFMGVGLIFFFQALQFLSGAEFLSVIGTEALQANALVAIDTFNSTWLVGLTAFGLHLIVLGVLIVRSGLAPKLLGWVLIVSGCAYMIDTVAHSLMSNYQDYETLFVSIVAIPAVFAEGWFGLWLLLRGGKNEVLPDPEVP